jgi:hypothetical protein
MDMTFDWFKATPADLETRAAWLESQTHYGPRGEFAFNDRQRSWMKAEAAVLRRYAAQGNPWFNRRRA